MIADVVVFTYRGRVKKRDISLRRAYRGDVDFRRIEMDVSSIFGPADRIDHLRGVDLTQYKEEFVYDLERLSGRNPKQTSPA